MLTTLFYRSASVSKYYNSEIPRDLHLIVKAYDLDKLTDETLTINVLGTNYDFIGSFTGDIHIAEYSYSYTIFTKSGSYNTGSIDKNVRVLNSYYRFMFRTFIYSAFQLTYIGTINVGSYTNVNNYIPIQNVNIQSGGSYIILSSTGGTAIAEYRINNDNDFYMDAHRYLKVKLAKQNHDNVNIMFKINNKEYFLNVSLSTTPTDFYIDLCFPSNSIQSVDYKNNNFDTDDSYSDYWGITKAKRIRMSFDTSFRIHEIKLTDRLPSETTYEHKYSSFIQRSTWQNGKRRIFVVRNRGKQTAEIADCTTAGEMTITQALSDFEGRRNASSWTITPAYYPQCSQTGEVRDLNPCLLNLDTPASFIHGGGCMFDGDSDTIYVNRDYINGSHDAQYLVDTVWFYPNCGDVFFDTSNSTRSGAIKLFAATIKRAQANGLVFNQNVNVVMQNDLYNAGNDTSDFYTYYYIKGDYAKRMQYRVEPAGYGFYGVVDCKNANEYRVCFRPVTPAQRAINDLKIMGDMCLAVVNIDKQQGKIYQFIPPNILYDKEGLYSSCLDMHVNPIYAGANLDCYTYGFLNQETIASLGVTVDMYPFVRRMNDAIIMTYYNPSSQNFNVRIFSNIMNVIASHDNVIEKETNEEIPEQNFPIDNHLGVLIGVFYSIIGSTKYVNFVVSGNFGKTWWRIKQDAI